MMTRRSAALAEICAPDFLDDYGNPPFPSHAKNGATGVMIEGIFFGTRLFVGTVLLLAAVGKLRDFPSFVQTVRSFRIASRKRERLVAYVVVIAEIVTALLMTIHDLAVYALSLAALELAAFTMAVLAALTRGDRIACGCFGSSNVLISKMHVLRNLSIMAVAIAGALSGAASNNAPIGTEAVVIAVVSATFGVAFILLLDQLLAIPAGQAIVAPGRRTPAARLPN